MANEITFVRNHFAQGTYSHLVVRHYDTHKQVVLGKMSNDLFWPNDISYTADDLVDIGNALADFDAHVA